MKAIESGCLCLIVSSVVPENNGRCVTAIRFVGGLHGYRGEDWWLIDSLITDTLRNHIPYIRACRLLRIYGNPEHSKAESLKDHYSFSKCFTSNL